MFSFKGTVSRDFLLLVFLWKSFPPAPEYPIRTVSNFFENSRRYSQVKMHHRCQRHRWQICHRCQWHRWQIAAGINDTGGKFPPVSTTPAANFATSSPCAVDTGGKFSAGVNDAGGKLPPVSTTSAANLPPVSLTPVANNENSIRLQTLWSELEGKNLYIW